MGSPAQDFDLLIAAADPVETSLVEGVLADADIPCFVHSQDFDVAELGSAAHMSLRHPDIYVPKGTLERARELLAEAWGEGFEARQPAARDAAALAMPKRTGLRRFWLAIYFVLPVALVALSIAAAKGALQAALYSLALLLLPLLFWLLIVRARRV